MLSKPDLLRYIKTGKIVFDPGISDEQIDQVSIDLRLGRHFSTFKELPEHFPVIRIRPSLVRDPSLWDQIESSTITLKPGKLVLAQTFETVRVPYDLVGMVEGRSTYGRVGIAIHVTAPKIDPGFEGTITLEMVNLGNATVELVAEEDKPAQIMFSKLSKKLKLAEGYGKDKADVYQYQDRPIPAAKKKR